MGFGRFLLLGDLGQQMDPAGQERQTGRQGAEAAKDPGGDLEPAVRRLQTENDELRMFVAAIIRLLTDKGVITRGELEELARTLDAEYASHETRHPGPRQ